MKISEIFVSHTGELDVGRFAIFFRLSGCTLDCDFCDSKYHKEGYAEMSVNDLVERAKHFHHIVITGGEPILQLEEVKEFIKKTKKLNPEAVFEIETNGTLTPVGMKDMEDILFNVSIKLTNNGNNTYEQRIKPEVIRWHVERQSRFKFVINTTNDVDEVSLLIDKYRIKKENVWLMPLGATRQEQLNKMLYVITDAKTLGVNFSPRLHTLIWDNKRGV